MAGINRTDKADKLSEQATKKLNSFDWFGAKREQNNEDAAELFIKAAAQYKISKEYMRAGECYEEAAKANMAADNQIEANTNWRESGNCYSHVDADRSSNAFKNAIQLYLDADRFGQAAKLTAKIAEMLAQEDKFKEAIEYYEQCIDYLEADNDQSGANKHVQTIAHMAAKGKQYQKAIECFEKVANYNVDNNLLRWNVKTLLFKAMICQFNEAYDSEKKSAWTKVEQSFEKYKDISDMFASSREGKLCAALLDALPKGDLTTFKDQVASFDTIQKLDPWCTEQLLAVEHGLRSVQNAAPDLTGFDDDEKEDFGGPDLTSAATDEPVKPQPDGPPDMSDAPDLL